MTSATFAALLDRLNARGRKAGACPAEVCAAWREGGEVKRVIEALLGWESATKRLAGPGDFRAVAEKAAEMRAAQEGAA